MAARAHKTCHHLGPEFRQLFNRKKSSFVLKEFTRKNSFLCEKGDEFSGLDGTSIPGSIGIYETINSSGRNTPVRLVLGGWFVGYFTRIITQIRGFSIFSR